MKNTFWTKKATNCASPHWKENKTYISEYYENLLYWLIFYEYYVHLLYLLLYRVFLKLTLFQTCICIFQIRFLLIVGSVIEFNLVNSYYLLLLYEHITMNNMQGVELTCPFVTFSWVIEKTEQYKASYQRYDYSELIKSQSFLSKRLCFWKFLLKFRKKSLHFCLIWYFKNENSLLIC